MLRRGLRTTPASRPGSSSNETWGLFSNLPGEVRLYEAQDAGVGARVYRRVKAFDPTRIVEDNSACNHDHVETDLNTWHFYINGYMAVKEEIDTACRSSYAGSRLELHRP